jgi:Tfp pilus assembly protein, ATPase PilM
MKNGIGYITLTDGKVHFLMRRDRNSEPLLLSMPVGSDEEALQAAVDCAEASGATLEKAVVSVDSRSCFLRNYRLPIQNRRQLDQVVTFELSEDLPLAEDELVFDYFRGSTADGLSYVCAAAVAKDRLAELISACETRGIELERVDVDAAAFARACTSRFADYERCVGLEIGAERILFCSLVRGKVRSVAVIPWGKSFLANEFARSAKLSVEEAERVMVLGGSGQDGDKPHFGEHLDKFLRKLMREVYRLLGDAEWPSCFIVSGEIVGVHGFRQEFEAVSDGSLHVWEEANLKLGDEIDEGQRGSCLAVGFGTAEESGGGFNLRKGEFAAVRSHAARNREIAYFAALALAIVLAWGVYAYASLVRGERDLAYVREATADLYRKALPDVSRSLAPVQYQSILSSRLQMLTGEADGSSSEQMESVIETLRIISAAIDAKVDVEFMSLSLDSERIDLQGEARTMNEVDALRASLVGSKGFKGVKVKNAVAEKRSGKIRFELEVQR